MEYQHFLTDPVFYDLPRERRSERGFAPASSQDWTGWRRAQDGPWVGWRLPEAVLPEQGWKVHVTATDATASGVLQKVSAYCHRHGLVFKHLASPRELLTRNAKEAVRGGSGKFITIYPRHVEELRSTLDGLEALVGGLPGPRVLSDLQWRDGPLSVRYGAFVHATGRDAHGRTFDAMRGPTGELVEDRRPPVFETPPWVELPGFLREQLDALGGHSAPDGFPYTITGSLHFSNGGGVYDATDAAGRRVVLKEARPFAGVTVDGRDATARLVDEERALRALAGPGIVRLLASHELLDHRFLALEHVDGTSLHTELVVRHPAIQADATPARYLEYRQWALAISDRIDAVVARVHDSGWVHGDLHPRNVIVTRDDDVMLLDFEMAHPAHQDRGVIIGAPGFVPPDGRTGVAADRYALACIRLFLFVPLTTLLPLDSRKLDELLSAACEHYALDDAWADAIRRDLALPSPAPMSAPAAAADSAIRRWDTTDQGVHALQVRIGRAIAASADYGRADRAWPGDPVQFAERGLGLAHGAAGVIHALDAAALDVDPGALEWFDGATAHALDDDTAPLGLYDGLAGAAWMHRRLGNDDLADRILERLRRLRRLDGVRVGADLYGGFAGIGLYLLSESSGDPRLVGAAADLASRAALRAGQPSRPDADDAPAGLMHGPSGTALLAIRLYQATGDAGFLELARSAIELDLSRCVPVPDGSVQVGDGQRVVPYLASGSAGIGLALAQLLPHLDDPEPYLPALIGIERAASTAFTIEPGLFDGRAGLIHLLILLSRSGLPLTSETERSLARHVDGLRVHALRYRDGIAFPGKRLLRVSSDLATGSAGVLTALTGYGMLAHDEEHPGWEGLLPLLLPPEGAFRVRPPANAPEGR